MKKPSDYYTFSRNEMVPFIPEKYSRVLEIGCGSGNFRKNLKPDCEYWGIEMDDQSAKKAESNNNIDKVLAGTFAQVYESIPANYFDLVICNDVIEHMPDHDEFIDSLGEKITEDSFIIGSTPNVRYIRNLIGILIKRDWKYKSQGVLDRTHLRFFTKKSLKRTFKDHGYKIDKFNGISNILVKNKLIKTIPNIFLFLLPVIILGQDVKYKQFGFRIKKK